ncbi:MAG TPA: UDP-N-acetylmuramate--L-alanine ligase [Egibacteraceae bacterium]|nr:UDP-N-acetylmuramate--L-alanine ligase [Egibacteraceae bacterium]
MSSDLHGDAGDIAVGASPLVPGARVHLVGVGGSGMSAVARVLLERGHPVSGSDLRGGPACSALAAMGAVVSIGHAAANVGDAELVAVSAAVPADNPEVVHAAEKGVPLLSRPQLLDALMRGRRRIGISGTHGKTTTTSMVTVALQQAGLDPSFAIGGALHDSGTSAHHGSGDVFVAEADEAYGSFLAMTVDCAVVTNIELDHHDYYADLDAVRTGFTQFLAGLGADGLAIMCADDAGAAALRGRVGARVVTYGESELSDAHITDVVLERDASRFRLRHDEDLGEFRLRLRGRHNVLNAAGAILAARWAGADVEAIREGLAAFGGAQRRFQRIGEAGGVTVIDDYGHHPTELAATLLAARQSQPAGRVIAVLQPHRYSRTAALARELGQALAEADLAVVTDVYAAGEPPVPGVTGGLVADAARHAGVETRFVAGAREVADVVVELARPGDLVLTMGAGDITEVGPVILRRLGERDG